MSIIELFIIAVALSMDAFAVSVCKGLCLRQIKPRHAVICGLYFGIFQAVMPLIGFFLANIFKGRIESIASYIAFALLVLIGVNMLREAFSKDEKDSCDTEPDMSFKAMLPLAISTSIDALVVGVSFSLTFADDSRGHIWYAVLFIGVITFSLSALGVKVGSIFGSRYEKKAEIAGGVILILMGLKVLLEQLGIINL